MSGITKDIWKSLETQYKILEGEPIIHGTPFDRGCADAYYHRTPSPHYWTNGNGLDGERIEELTEKQNGNIYLVMFFTLKEKCQHVIQIMFKSKNEKLR